MLSKISTSSADVDESSIHSSHAEVQTAARSIAGSMPDLFIEAKNIASTIAFGWHGRKRAGSGETFWQYRPFNHGEPVRRIDWRRSARDEHLFVREHEWEAAHTVWLWADLTRSMNFQSNLASVTKRDRALVLMLGIAELLARSGERIGIPGTMRPVCSRRGAEKLTEALMRTQNHPPLPESNEIKRFSDVIVFADFLDPMEEIQTWLESVARTGARGHFIQILDPVEETFPFDGRMKFEDPESGIELVTGRAQDWKLFYQEKISRRQEELRSKTLNAGWSYILHHTDRPAVEPLLALHSLLSQSNSLSENNTGNT